MAEKSIKGTRTEKNLVIAYLAESSAYTRYMFYAAAAEKENYFPISKIFQETAANEMRHGKVFFKFLQGGSVNVPMDADAGVIGTTAENLATAAHEEMVEGVELYTNAAKVADEEGFPEIAAKFRMVGAIEKTHEERYRKLLNNVQTKQVFAKGEMTMWECRICGHIVVGTSAPDVCPVCHYAQSFFEVRKTNY